MTRSPLKLPIGLRPQAEAEIYEADPPLVRLPRGQEDASRIELAKIQLAKEGLKTVTAFFGMVESYLQYRSTEKEWKGRVRTAELELQKAELALQQSQETNQVQMKKLEQTKETQDRLLCLFDDVMDEFKSLPQNAQARTDIRQQLLKLSDLLVKLRA